MVKRLLQSLMLVAVGLAAAVLMMEGLLRAFPSLLPVELHLALVDRGVPHPAIGNLPEPNSTGTIWTRDFKITHRVDEFGFRNAGAWPERPDVAVIGDSLVFGYGVEINDAWPQRLAAMTGKTVINLGLIGAGPQQYLRIYETFARERRPRWLVIGFFASNEFWDAQQYDRWLASGAGGNYMEWRDFGRPGAEQVGTWKTDLYLWLRKHSHVANLIDWARRALRRRPNTDSAQLLELGEGERLRLDLNYLSAIARNSQPDNRFFDITAQALADIHRSASAQGTRLLIVFEPSKEEIYLPLVDRVPLDPAGPLQSRLQEIGIAYLDLAPFFRARAQAGEKLFFENDGHPNAAGYRLIAEQVAAYLRSESAGEQPARTGRVDPEAAGG